MEDEESFGRLEEGAFFTTMTATGIVGGGEREGLSRGYLLFHSLVDTGSTQVLSITTKQGRIMRQTHSRPRHDDDWVQ